MRKNDYDSRILIYRSRRLTLLLCVTVMTVLFTLLLLRGQEEGLSWYQMAGPLTIFGLSFILFPKTEEWEYKPWQSKPRKIEQNFDR